VPEFSVESSAACALPFCAALARLILVAAPCIAWPCSCWLSGPVPTPVPNCSTRSLPVAIEASSARAVPASASSLDAASLMLSSSSLMTKYSSPCTRPETSLPVGSLTYGLVNTTASPVSSLWAPEKLMVSPVMALGAKLVRLDLRSSYLLRVLVNSPDCWSACDVESVMPPAFFTECWSPSAALPIESATPFFAFSLVEASFSLCVSALPNGSAAPDSSTRMT
jgi:hypothetical protein